MQSNSEFKKDVYLYLHLRDLQLDAQEDDEMGLAESIGTSMRALADKHDHDRFYKAVEEA